MGAPLCFQRLVRKVEALPAGKAEEWGGTPHTGGAHGLGHGTRPSHLRAEGWPDNVGNLLRKVDVLPAGTVKALDGSAQSAPDPSAAGGMAWERLVQW